MAMRAWAVGGMKIGESRRYCACVRLFSVVLILAVGFCVRQNLCADLLPIPEQFVQNQMALSFEELCEVVGCFDIRPTLVATAEHDRTLVGKKLYTACLREYVAKTLTEFIKQPSVRTLSSVTEFLSRVTRVQKSIDILEKYETDWFDFFRKTLLATFKKYHVSEKDLDDNLPLILYRAARPTSVPSTGATSHLPAIDTEIQAVIQTTVNYINQQGSLSLNRLLVTGPLVADTIEAQSVVLPTTGYPITAAQAATKKYVDEVAQGLHVKAACRLASTVAICVGGAKPSGPQTIDGYAVADGDRILLKNEILDAQKWNGIWLANTTGTWLRPEDFKAGSSAAGAFVFVMTGAANADTGWVCTTDKPNDIVDTDPLVFTQFAGPGAITMENVGGTDPATTGLIYRDRVGTVYYLRSVKSGNNIAVATVGDNVTVATTDDITAKNLIIKNGAGDTTCCVTGSTGDICTRGQVAAAQSSCSVSDARIKTDVRNLEERQCLEKINQLRPVAFKFTKEWREKNHQAEKINFGLIAQEVQKTIPEIVSKNNFPDDKTLSTVSYEQLIPYLIGSVQALTHEVAILRAQLAERDKK